MFRIERRPTLIILALAGILGTIMLTAADSTSPLEMLGRSNAAMIQRLEARIAQLEAQLEPAAAPLHEGYLTPQAFGAVANDARLDTEALQQLFDEAARTNANVYFPPGQYRVDRTIKFEPSDRKNVKQTFHFTGYGAEIKHVGESGYAFWFIRTGVEFYLTLEGFRFEGNKRLDVNGLRVEGITQSSFRDMQFARCDRGFDFIVGWNNVLENLSFGNTGRSGFRGMTNSGSGCQGGYNVNTHTNFRVHGGNWTWKEHQVMPESHYHLAGSGNVMQDFTTEGKHARYGFVLDNSGNCMKENTIRNVHEESQDWKGLSNQDHYSLYLPELRHQINLHWVPRYGVKCDKDNLGQLIIHGAGLGGQLISDKTGKGKPHAVPRMTGISRGLHIYTHAHKGLTESEYEAIVRLMGRENPTPAKLRYRMICNGTLFFKPVNLEKKG